MGPARDADFYAPAPADDGPAWDEYAAWADGLGCEEPRAPTGDDPDEE